MTELSGLRALVSGGASGIGFATANLMREQGALVGVLDQAPTADGGFEYACADVTDGAAVRRAVQSVVERFGGLDLLVNNAGIGAVGGIEDNDEAEWRHVLDVNVLGLVRVTSAALPALRRSRCPAVVNVTSIVATTGVPARALYAATKGAVHALTLAMAADLIPDGIRVNAVSPGTVDTPWVERLLAVAADPIAERAALEARQPHGRLVKPEEVASAIAFLASPASGSTTGTTLAVDGGFEGLRLRLR